MLSALTYFPIRLSFFHCLFYILWRNDPTRIIGSQTLRVSGGSLRGRIVLHIMSYSVSVGVLKIGSILPNSDALGVYLFLIGTDVSCPLLASLLNIPF